ncbi:leishmanolysin-related zinc metalloendopeptidase [Deinococcus cellulosilyticus]|uniref:Uncharacterized protein n=1 Tax=Deinococcus cellulosilyticus (strain DSM 18568 / NBRC 106333 / KACC 11606 / 5516J-15) TaxID=1223518 RepID=A0A511N1I8_DEIC1|nr:leishmanolysin-related zinc metalloendopeptidase [Deinococcus cellulosilyticus]GEM46321.1 hypothetical protein DC3_19560 [Deinococcus cellulosilyticus NBRC 106333 = KACC 11606]
MKTYGIALLTVLLASCSSTRPPSPTPTKPTTALPQLLEIQVEGIGTAKMSSSARILAPQNTLARQALVPVQGRLQFKALGASSFDIEATGKRYISAVYQVTNNTGHDLNNLSFVGVNLDDTDGDSSNNAMQPTAGNTAFAKLKFFNGSDASSKADLLSPGPLYSYDIPSNQAVLNPAGPTFNPAVDTSKLIPETPTGLSMNVLNFGWTLEGNFPAGTSRNVTFSMSFDLAEDPHDDPYSFSLMAAFAEEPVDPFNITLDFSGDTVLTDAQKATIRQAADRWEQVITHGLNDVQDGETLIDDLVISVRAYPFSSPGFLAQAGATHNRASNMLPFRGILEINQLNLEKMMTQNTLKNVVLHEMGHVLGFNTDWNSPFVAKMTYNWSWCGGATSIVFNGVRAMQEYQALGGSGGVPVQQDGRPGTCAHWQESSLGDDIMTTFLTGSGPLSRITVATLGDIGYRVNVAAGDPLTLPGTGLLAPTQQEKGLEFKEHIIKGIVVPGT